MAPPNTAALTAAKVPTQDAGLNGPRPLIGAPSMHGSQSALRRRERSVDWRPKTVKRSLTNGIVPAASTVAQQQIRGLQRLIGKHAVDAAGLTLNGNG